IPQYIGKWFPRNDRDELRLQYILMMLCILKPWQTFNDLLEGGTIPNQAWLKFLQESNGKYDAFIENVQYFYRCSDQS
ncbi:hypothetical protein EV368DRAFT_5935, partial [Lentinula lateritia]